MNLSPSTYKTGIVQITQPWDRYYNAGRRTGKLHRGIDIVCGVNPGDKAQTIEPGYILEVREGTKRKSGTVVMQGQESDMVIKYKHIGDFRVNKGDLVEAGTILGKPNFTNTESLHLHFETWNNQLTEHFNPLEYLIIYSPELKFRFSKYFKPHEYISREFPDLYDIMIERDTWEEEK